MSATGWAKSCAGRVAVISGATVVAMALLLGKPLLSATFSAAPATQTAQDRGLSVETVSLVASPAIDTDSEYFIGCGDGSNGFYVRQSQPTPASTRND